MSLRGREARCDQGPGRAPVGRLQQLRRNRVGRQLAVDGNGNGPAGGWSGEVELRCLDRPVPVNCFVQRLAQGVSAVDRRPQKADGLSLPVSPMANPRQAPVTVMPASDPHGIPHRFTWSPNIVQLVGIQTGSPSVAIAALVSDGTGASSWHLMPFASSWYATALVCRTSSEEGGCSRPVVRPE